MESPVIEVLGDSLPDGRYWFDALIELNSGASPRIPAGEAQLSAPRRPIRDPKSALQEWAQGRGLPTPTYTVVEQVGPDHAPQFRIAVKVEGGQSGLGIGSSKRTAEQAAARNLLLSEGVWTEEQHDVA